MAKYQILNQFYRSKEWITLRLNLIAERGPICATCDKRIGIARDIIGHHKIELTPENVIDHNISLNPKLIELLCFDCHNKEHNRFGYNAQKKVVLVYGPPMSGKSTFVRQHMKHGDIVVDMDALYAAVTGLPQYEKPDSLYANVVAIQGLLLDQIKTRYGKWQTAFVVGGYADKYKRERLAKELGAELVYCEASKQECYDRLLEDNERQFRIPEWQKYIDKWFEQYTL